MLLCALLAIPPLGLVGRPGATISVAWELCAIRFGFVGKVKERTGITALSVEQAEDAVM